MKKIGNVVLVFVIILLIAAVGFGGWYFVKKDKESSEKIAELENKIASSNDKKNEEITNNNDTTTAESDKTKEANEAIRKVLKDDSWINYNIRIVGDFVGENGIKIKKLANVNNIPSYFIAWDLDYDDGSGNGILGFVVTYDGTKVIVSKDPLNPYVDFGSENDVEVDTKNNYAVVSSTAEGDSVIYKIDGTEFKKIAKSVYNGDGMRFYDEDGKEISESQFEKYTNNLSKIDVELNDSNVDKYVK